MLELSLLLLIVVLVLISTLVACARWISRSCDTAANDEQTISDHASTQMLILQRRIDELRRIESLSLQHVRDLRCLLTEVYPSHLTSVQRSHIEAGVSEALVGKRVCWELEANDISDRTTLFWEESRDVGGYWLMHTEFPPLFNVICHTYDRRVVFWGQKQLFTASGYIAEAQITWPSLHLLVSGATVHGRPDNRALPVKRVNGTNTETTLSNDPESTRVSFRVPDMESQQYGPAPSYQTAPLTSYSRTLFERAEGLFKIIKRQIGPKAQQYKGSFTAFASSSSETAGKIVIYQQGLGRENGLWPTMSDGVYILVRCNGSSGRAIWQASALWSNTYWERLDPQRTLGIAPKHNERFAYFRLEPEDKIEIVAALLVACSSA
jgi:hypothetical protein